MSASSTAVWLSHILDNDTPLYAGAADIQLAAGSRIAAGAGANTTRLRLTSHSGTHVDVPYHFLEDGRRLDSYPPEQWLFAHPLVVHAPVAAGDLIEPDHLRITAAVPADPDLVLIVTGFETRRRERIYWEQGPGLSPSLASWLKDRWPGLRAVGLDCISISSLAHRESGRTAHRAFLSRDIRLFEDMALSAIGPGRRLTSVTALPLRHAGGDGAPCTVIGFVEPA